MVTAGKEAKLKGSADRSVIASDGSDLSYITIDVTDGDDNFVPTASNKINFDISGDGEIVGVDNGNPISRERYKDKKGSWSRSAFNGKALVIVRSTKEAGSFTITATSGDLEACSVTVNTEPRAADLSEDGTDTVQPPADQSFNTPDPGADMGTQGQNTGVANPGSDTQVPSGSAKEKTKSQFTKGAFIYKVISAGKKTVQIKSLAKKNTKKAVIPATVNYKGITHKVTAIGKKAFNKCKKLNTVIIGKNVTKIQASAFYSCKKLRRITLKSKK
ncbi:MAG: leucine-rich repeat protein [Eubacterium sp.]|nr:leucine-rich repeat protein [Eubacterium sp.]